MSELLLLSQYMDKRKAASLLKKVDKLNKILIKNKQEIDELLEANNLEVRIIVNFINKEGSVNGNNN